MRQKSSAENILLSKKLAWWSALSLSTFSSIELLCFTHLKTELCSLLLMTFRTSQNLNSHQKPIGKPVEAICCWQFLGVEKHRRTCFVRKSTGNFPQNGCRCNWSIANVSNCIEASVLVVAIASRIVTELECHNRVEQFLPTIAVFARWKRVNVSQKANALFQRITF